MCGSGRTRTSVPSVAVVGLNSNHHMRIISPSYARPTELRSQSAGLSRLVITSFREAISYGWGCTSLRNLCDRREIRTPASCAQNHSLWVQIREPGVATTYTIRSLGGAHVSRREHPLRLRIVVYVYCLRDFRRGPRPRCSQDSRC